MKALLIASRIPVVTAEELISPEQKVRRTFTLAGEETLPGLSPEGFGRSNHGCLGSGGVPLERGL